MKSTQTIFCKDDGTVTISASEYNKLLLYKELALEMKDVLQGDAEWITQSGKTNGKTTHTSPAHTIINVMAANTAATYTQKVMKNDNRNPVPTQ